MTRAGSVLIARDRRAHDHPGRARERTLTDFVAIQLAIEFPERNVERTA